jgi:ribosome-associated protein
LIVGKQLARTLANAAHHKLAFDIELLEVRKLSSYTDFLLIMSGKNRLHLDALLETLKELIMDREVRILGIEGSAQSGWVIIDIGSIIIHIFDPEKRSYYNLYSLWGDAPSVELEFSKTPPALRKARKKGAK